MMTPDSGINTRRVNCCSPDESQQIPACLTRVCSVQLRANYSVNGYTISDPEEAGRGTTYAALKAVSQFRGPHLLLPPIYTKSSIHGSAYYPATTR